MKNNISLWIALVIVAGLSVYASFFKKVIKQEIYPTTTIQAPAPPTVERTTLSYATVSADNAFITNKIMFTPVVGSVNVSYAKTNGQLWYDGSTGNLRFWDGNTIQGVNIVTGRYSEDSVTFRALAGDSVDFSPLFDEYAWGVDYTLRIDSLSGVGATVTFKQFNAATGHYLSMDDVVFPYTLAIETKKFYAAGIQKYQRVLIEIGSATKVKGALIRKIRIGQ